MDGMMNRDMDRREFIKVAGLAAGALALGVPRVRAASEPVKIGTLMPYTGALAAYGPAIRNGTILAVEHINKAGGLLGGPVLLVHRDSQTSPQAATDAAQKLVQLDRVPAFVGALSSGVTLAASSVSIPNKVVQISPASTSPQLTALEDDGYVFRTCPSDALQGVVAGKLARDLGFKKVSTIYVNNAYGVGLSDEFSKSYTQRGGVVPAAVAYEKGQPSYRSELKKALSGKPDAVAVFGYPENGATILRQAIEGGYAGKFLLADGMKEPSLIDNVGAKYLNGTFGTAPGSKNTRSSDIFTREYKKAFGELPPKPFITNAYDAMATIALAIQKAGEATGTAIRDNIRAVSNPPGEKIYVGEFEKAFDLLRQGKDIDYVGAAGDVDYDEHGDVVTPIEVWKIEDGKITHVRAEEVAR